MLDNDTEVNKNNEEQTVTSSNSETVAPVTETSTVTSSSPTTSVASSFQPFQQLHEAVLAAVNSHNVGLQNSLFSAAIAAAAANNNVTIHPQPFEQLEEPAKKRMTEAESAKKESIRASNRERKKKWRLHNEERNKDNDLRCRVNKRAQKLFGAADSATKQQWINEEFEKRRQKRMEKERRKHIVNNVLSVPGTSEVAASNDLVANDNNTATNNNGLSSLVGTSYYTPLPQIDSATAAKLLDFPTDLQRQLLEQLNHSMMALTNGLQQQASQGATTNTETHQSVDSESTENANTIDPVAAATQAALQQVIAQGLSASTNDSSNDHQTPAVPVVTEDKIKEEEVEVKQDVKEENDSKEEKKTEYPMDAVLTLMQLNAGWRQ